MEDLLLYFTKSAGVLVLFLGLYFVILRRETFFQENRFFLLFGMLISLLLPFLVITRYIEIPVITQQVSGNFVVQASNIPAETSHFSWMSVLAYTYLAGVLVFFGKFLIELFSLFRLLWKSDVTKRDGQFIYIETNANFSPFSFFNYIVYNPALYSASELEAILKHEQAHSRQLHSMDVFVSKLYCIFFWFNPFAWLHTKFMLQNLEFLADSAAIKQTPSKKAYQLTLLKVSGNTYSPALTNNFYNSLIKKRIVMLQKTQSTHTKRWKQLLIFPLLIAFVFLFNTEVIAKEVTNTYDNPIIETTAGDLVVVITKNTSMEELKAYKKLFKSQKITFEYSDVKFNGKKEISSISIKLSIKNSQEASGKFASIDEEAISDIQVGKRGDELFVMSKPKAVTGAYAYTFSSDDDTDGKKKKIVIRTDDNGKTTKKTWIQKENIQTVDIKKEDGEEVIIINGKKLSPAETIDIKKNGEKEIIIINGKRLDSDTIIEEEIEIKNEGNTGNVYSYSISTDTDEKEVEDKKFKIIKKKENKIVFNTSNGKEKPLVFVDGKKVSYEKFKDLDADNIKTVEVLKGESATKKYGDEGKNGVILVTTKKE
ncbi:TonB-dependent receptor-like protein [Kordia periserrulae]|uniref:TonB-dependent receptor-like protein n=1 Tax=Kordia periserrulae TaxID=701523 RepID=A0A2T6BTR5_9FLAO|nr:M56 family metallopeptidase [Kordia periserrulae]PTX59475.1 TonB-dependent receptor-like protein [Kordia periserrulae]